MLRVESEVCLFLNQNYMEQNTVKFKSKVFAKNIIFLYQKILAEKREYVLSKQLLRCGTSIGANLAESECAISTNDFLSKVYISLKEASETIFWLDLLHETGYICINDYTRLKKDCEEIKRMLSATTKTIVTKLKTSKQTPN